MERSKSRHNKKRRITIDGLLKNNKFLFVFSLLVAFIVWVILAQNITEETTTTIYDVPISVELPETLQNDGYKIYRGEDSTASVQIKGNRITVGSITKDDIQVSALDMNTVNSANTYFLSLAAKKTGVKTDYEIISVSPSIISIFVDKESEREFNIEDQINLSNIKIPEGYYLSKPSFSKGKIKIKGPETEIKKIDKVIVRDTIDGEQSQTITKTENIIFLDSSGDEINSPYLSPEFESVNVTIQIMPEKDLPLKLSFKNVPKGIDASALASVSPATIKIAGPESVLSSIDEYKLDDIDFSSLSPNDYQAEMDIVMPDGCVNISNVDKAVITYDFTNYNTSVVYVENSEFKITGLKSGYGATVTTSGLDIDVAGLTSELDDITSDNIEVTVDLSKVGNNFLGQVEVPVNVSFKNADNCWTYETYNANVFIYQKVT